MIDFMEKSTIVTLKNKGKSNREIARITGFDRKTIAKYWKLYQRQLMDLDSSLSIQETQEAITSEPRYDSSGRGPTKFTPQIDAAIDEVLACEAKKCKELGITHKQKLTNVQIHELIVARGFDIGRSTVAKHVALKREKAREAFIRQEYDLGNRLEYDFGEVRLVIGGKVGTYYLAALAAPASSFRYAYLYENQKKDAFVDSHVRFFEAMGGVWKEVVYDNMRNVVACFIGKNEKELNTDLLKMSIYYGFNINVTNCFSGNEKGYVESSVKWIRNRVFAPRYTFDTLDGARAYLAAKLELLNATSRIEEEKQHLLRARPALEIAKIEEHVVDKYSFIRVDNNFYSVPDYLVGHMLTVKSYPEKIIVFSGFAQVCEHKRVTGKGLYQVDIFHYLDTLVRKPAAIRNSTALRSKQALKDVFDQHYQNCPKDFIVALEAHKGQPIDKIAISIAEIAKGNTIITSRPHTQTIAENVKSSTKKQLAAISSAFLKGGEKIAC